jgi:hypothetical protein
MSSKAQSRFTPLSFGLRFLFALTLIVLTFNPTGYSYVHWLQAGELGPEHLLGGILLIIGWAMFVRATLRSLGPIGLILGAVFFGAVIWVLFDFEILTSDTMTALTWISIVCLAGLLAVGMSWSHIRRRASGQYDVDDVNA